MYLCDKISYCRFCRRQIGTNCKILNETRLRNKKKVPKYCIFNKTQPSSELRHTYSNSLVVIIFSRLSLSLFLSLSLSHLSFLTVKRWKVKEFPRSKYKWAYSLVLHINHFAFESICQTVKSVDEQICQKHKNTFIVSRSLSV